MDIRRIVSSNWNRLIESDIKKIVQPPLVAYSYDRTIGSLICNYPQFARSEHATKCIGKLRCACKGHRLNHLVNSHHDRTCRSKIQNVKFLQNEAKGHQAREEERISQASP